MPLPLDSIMEQASEALARMDYLECEARCLEALRLARSVGDWSSYARVLLPLQESRRQRRMIAAEGVIRLGTTDLEASPAEWFTHFSSGCIVLTQPHDASVATRLLHEARDRRMCVEVLWADCPTSAGQWLLRSFEGPDVRCTLKAPPAEWIDTWLQQPLPRAKGGQPGSPETAADWFLDACEALGDAALRELPERLNNLQALESLERCLLVVTDHEIIHQRLAAAARAMPPVPSPESKPPPPTPPGVTATTDPLDMEPHLPAAAPPSSPDSVPPTASASPPSTETPPPPNKRRLNLRTIFIVCIAALFGTGLVLYWLWKSEPRYWKEHQEFLQTHPPQQIQEMAHDVERRVLDKLSLLTSGGGVGAAAGATGFTPETGEPGSVAVLAAGTGQPQTISLTLDEANAWIAARLDDWLENRYQRLPQGVKDPMLAIEDGQPVLAFKYETDQLQTVVSFVFDLTIGGDGRATLKLLKMRAGKLPVPANLVNKGLTQTAADQQLQDKLAQFAKTLDGYRFSPIVKINNKRLRMLAFKLRDNGMDVTVRADPNPYAPPPAKIAAHEEP